MPKGKGRKGTKKSPSKKKPDESTGDASEPAENENIPTSETDPENNGMTPDTEPTPDPGHENVELASPVPAPTPESPPEPETDESKPDLPRLPKIPLKVFEKIAGPKWDQLAGFKQHAKANNLGPMTVPEWRDALQAFKNKPT